MNPTIQVLGESVSFGRYVCEDLEWEKWSSFNNSTNRNRHVVEAEKYSKPGSVAQKKAYFEAHFKKMAALKAAALLEQAQNNVLHDHHDHDHDHVQDLDSSSNLKEGDSSKGEFKVFENEIYSSEGKDDESKGNDHMCKDVNSSPPPPPPLPPPLDHKSLQIYDEGIGMNKEDHVVNNELSEIVNQREIPSKEQPNVIPAKWGMKQMEVPPKEQPSIIPAKLGMKQMEVPPIEQPSIISEKWDMKKMEIPPKEQPNIIPEKWGMKQMEVPLLQEELTEVVKKKKTPLSSYISSPSVTFATSPVKSDYIHPGNENYSTPIKTNNDPQKKKTPLRMSINREFNRILSPVIKKLGTSSKTSTPSKTPAKGSMNNNVSQTQPQPMTPDLSKRGATASPSTVRSKANSPIIPNSFCLSNGERTARRKQKLEDKFNAATTERLPQPSKFKEKAEAELNKFRQSFCFKAMSSPDYNGDNGSLKSPKHKNASTHRKSPIKGKPSNRTTSQNTSLPPRRPSVKQNGLRGKRNTLLPS